MAHCGLQLNLAGGLPIQGDNMFVYEDFSLPNFRIGYDLNAENKYFEDGRDFDGPFVFEKKSTEAPVTTSVVVFCDKYNCQDFIEFFYQVSSYYAGYFKKTIAVQGAMRQQIMRIVSGIPQAKQVRDTFWEFSFTVEIPKLNTETETVEYDRVSPYPYGYVNAPNMWQPMRRGAEYADVNVNAIDVSDDGRTVVVAMDGGRAAVSRDGGWSFYKLQRYLGTGVAGSNVITAAITSDGNKVLFGLSNGTMSISTNSAKSFTAIVQPTESLGADLNTLSMSKDGGRIIAGYSNGYMFTSEDDGATWTVLFQGVTGASAIQPLSSTIADDGETFFFGMQDGHVTMFTSSGAARTELVRGFGTGVFNDVITMASTRDGESFVYAALDDGHVARLNGHTYNTYTVLSRGLAYNADGSPYPNTLSIAVSPVSDTVLFGMEGGKFSVSEDNGNTLSKIGNSLRSGGTAQNFNAVAGNGAMWYAGQDEGYLAFAKPDFFNVEDEPPFDYPEPDSWGDAARYLGSGGDGAIYDIAAGKTSRYFFTAQQNGYASYSNDGSSFISLPRFLDSGLSTAIDLLSVSCSYDGLTAIFTGEQGLCTIVRNGSVLTPLTVANPGGGKDVDIPGVGTNDLYASAMSYDGSTIYIGGEGGLLRRSRDGGQTFENINHSPPAQGSGNVSCMACSTYGTILYIGYEDGYVYVSKDYGNTVTELTRYLGSTAGTNDDVLDLECTADGKIAFVSMGNKGGMRLDNYGADITVYPPNLGITVSGAAKDFNAMTCSMDGRVIIAALSDGYIAYSDNYGKDFVAGPQYMDASQSFEIFDIDNNEVDILAGGILGYSARGKM